MNDVAKILNEYKHDNARRQSIADIRKAAEPVEKIADQSSSERLKKFMSTGDFVLNLISSKEDAYIAIFNKIKETMSQSPLGKLVFAYHDKGLDALFTTLLETRDAGPLSQALKSADDAIVSNTSTMQSIRRDLRFDRSVMGDGIFTFCLIHRDKLTGLSKEQIDHMCKIMNHRGKKVTKSFDLIVVQMVELLNVLDDLDEQIKIYDATISEKSNNIRKIFGAVIDREWVLLKNTRMPDYQKEISDFITMRNSWAAWSNLQTRELKDYRGIADSNS